MGLGTEAPGCPRRDTTVTCLGDLGRFAIEDVRKNFGEAGGEPAKADGGDDQQPLAEARMIAATTGGVRVASLYAPNGRLADSPFYRAKLVCFDRLARWLGEACSPDDALILGGDLNVAPTDADVWDPGRCHGGTHVSPPERAAFERLARWGLLDGYRRHHPEGDRFTWWDYRLTGSRRRRQRRSRTSKSRRAPSVARR